MTEPRMRLRQKGQQFPASDYRILPRVPLPKETNLFTRTSVEAFLIAFGDSLQPLPSTIRVLDEIVTDYIIETCHEAAAVATHARRQKIKLDDFKFMLRRDTAKLGRVSEMLETDKELKRKRKAFDTDEGAVTRGVEEVVEKGGEKAPEKEGKERVREEGEPRKKKKKRERGLGDAGTVRSG